MPGVVTRTALFALRMLPGMLLAAVLYGLFLPLRRRRLRRKDLESSVHRERGLLLFWMFCGALAALTLLPRWLNWWELPLGMEERPFFQPGTMNLTLFRSFYDSYIVAANVLLFVPVGCGVGLFWRKSNWLWALLVGMGLTGGIESWQLLVGRAFDVDDLMLNTIGVLLGFGLWTLWKHLAPRSCEGFHCHRRIE